MIFPSLYKNIGSLSKLEYDEARELVKLAASLTKFGDRTKFAAFLGIYPHWQWYGERYKVKFPPVNCLRRVVRGRRTLEERLELVTEYNNHPRKGRSKWLAKRGLQTSQIGQWHSMLARRDMIEPRWPQESSLPEEWYVVPCNPDDDLMNAITEAYRQADKKKRRLIVRHTHIPGATLKKRVESYTPNMAGLQDETTRENQIKMLTEYDALEKNDKRAYCEKHRITAHTLCLWRTTLRKAGYYPVP